ncbi:putative RNA-directed DNA polymerase from transposon BS [Labeo rohita]|uniref:RNA-directed DNA polymerase from transposon BS n=1 Tax=Labeo rohita TaxID=84645 RepID=A0ABQ8LBZ9_LABRO|nr:putative RNA-directed DNA polymerase from transposon BS [Labeo rohita]
MHLLLCLGSILHSLAQISTCALLNFAQSCTWIIGPLSDLDADQHLSLLNSAWLKVANATAPLKPHKQKPKSELWQNSETHLLRPIYSLTSYQSAAKSAKAAYFSNFIETNHSKPKSVVNPFVNTLPVASDVVCEGFLRYFSDKITTLRLGICPTLTVNDSPIMPAVSTFWEVFEPISFQVLKERGTKCYLAQINFTRANLLCGPNENSQSFSPDLDSLSVFSSSQVRNLGVLIDQHLKFDKHIAAVIGSSFYQLRLLAKVKHFLTPKTLEMAVHAFVTSRLDYCNSLYCGISKSQIARLQLVQNAAARLLRKCRKHEHITPILKDLHWLPVSQRIHFKILLFVYKSLHNLAPAYLSELLHLYSPSRTLRSCDQALLVVPHVRLKRRGARAFAVSGPQLWNILLLEIRMAPSLSSFKSLLKTYFFSLVY